MLPLVVKWFGGDMVVEFNLPGSSFDEICKIVKGYGNSAENSTLDQLSKLIGLHVSSISRSSKFLSDIGLITGGMKKSATELARKLGRALEHNQENDAITYWKEAVYSCEKVAGLVTTLRIKGGMKEADFTKHILYVSGQKNTGPNRTGARCVVDLLLAADLIKEENGRLTHNSVQNKLGTEDIVPSEQQVIAGTENIRVAPSIMGVGGPIPQIAINIQLHLPETDNAEVYEKLFKALKEHLLRGE